MSPLMVGRILDSFLFPGKRKFFHPVQLEWKTTSVTIQIIQDRFPVEGFWKKIRGSSGMALVAEGPAGFDFLSFVWDQTLFLDLPGRSLVTRSLFGCGKD